MLVYKQCRKAEFFEEGSLLMAKRTGVTLFDLEEGTLFKFGYDLNTTYRLIGMTDDGIKAIVRAQREGADDEMANPYYNDIVRV
jgi:hypothetical protein